MYGKSLGLGLVLAACFVVGQGSASGEPYTWSWGPQSVSVEYGTASGAVRTRSDYDQDQGMISPHGQENARAMISFSVFPLMPSSGMCR